MQKKKKKKVENQKFIFKSFAATFRYFRTSLLGKSFVLFFRFSRLFVILIVKEAKLKGKKKKKTAVLYEMVSQT